ncbi:MAG: amidohydrolase family protein [Pseudomonadota bacterium]|nr:amidohydrolase family protein [Pseudomonadota bacterium]
METSRLLRRARLPAWLLPSHWPRTDAQPSLADISIVHTRIARITPHMPSQALPCMPIWDLDGAPVLPGLLDAHVHLDKTFTRARMGAISPGLLSAIDAMMVDKARWTPGDVRHRAECALHWAQEAGSMHLRTHCDWWDPISPPIAWSVLRELAEQWRGRLKIERVSLSPLTLYEDRDWAFATAARVASSGPGALLGGFVHSTHFSVSALRHLLEAAQAYELDVDLHCDEELEPAAKGLATVVTLMSALGFEGRVVCGHVCALAAKPESEALRILDAVATQRITLVALPATNLILQDAVAGRTPRQRGLTLVKEARARGIPVLLASDNVQDAFCPTGSYDPLEALLIGTPMGQLESPFDTWSDTICHTGALAQDASVLPLQAGMPADLVIFPASDAWSFPSRTQPRVVLRGGVPTGSVPANWSMRIAAQGIPA